MPSAAGVWVLGQEWEGKPQAGEWGPGRRGGPGAGETGHEQARCAGLLCDWEPLQLPGKPRWAIDKHESTENVDFTEQLLGAVRLFSAGSFACWACRNEIFPCFPVRGKLKKNK